MMLFDQVLEEPDKNDNVESAMLNMINIFSSPSTQLQCLGVFSWIRIFWPIRIRAQEKKSDPDKRTRIRNTGYKQGWCALLEIRRVSLLQIGRVCTARNEAGVHCYKQGGCALLQIRRVGYCTTTINEGVHSNYKEIGHCQLLQILSGILLLYCSWKFC